MVIKYELHKHWIKYRIFLKPTSDECLLQISRSVHNNTKVQLESHFYHERNQINC